jgi:uncharacterized delta-60 repeat protein
MIEPSTLRILNAKGQTIGTGFLVSQTLAVTCAHVAMAAAPDGENRIRAQFTGQRQSITVKVLDACLDLERDVAILEIESAPEGVQPLRLGLAKDSASGNPFFAFGYASAAKIQGIGTRGQIITLLPDGRLLQIRSHEADHGISGAPVLDEKRGVVVGMITKGHEALGRNQETTFATPAERFFEICSELRPSETCPYLGLEAFTAESAQFFFGREALTGKLLTVIKGGCRFLAVFGPSGSGKSSVVRAGLLPALANGQIPGSQKWAQVTIRPADDPFAQMKALSLGLRDIDGYLRRHPGMERIVLFVDQFEELFTLCPNELRDGFVRDLAAALDASHFALVISMRDDFYSAFNAKAAPLAASTDKVVVDVPVTLERADLVAMIEQPAAAVGLALEEGLTDVIIKDAMTDGAARSATLPLLEFALTQLWEQRRDGLLTHDAYQSIGGVTGSLARWADDAYSDLPKADQPLAESLLTALVHLGDEAQGLPDTRRRRALAEFDEPTRRVIKHFADRRLLVTGGETVELVHDALVREWSRLQGWIDKNREQLRVIEAVSEAAKAWSAAPKNVDLLVHRGGRLEDALKLQNRMSTQERTYLATCKTSEQRRRQNTIISIALAVLIVVSILAGWAWTSNQNSIQLGYKASTAEAAQATAVGEANIRATAQADAEAQKREAEKQAQIAFARQLAAQAQAIYAKHDLKQMTAVLLAVQSMKSFLSGEAAQILQNNAPARSIARMAYAHDVYSVAFSPDGKYVASGGCDQQDSNNNCIQGSARVWDATTGKEISRMTHNGPVSSVTFSSDGKFVVSGGEYPDNTARVWEASTGKEIARMTHDGEVYSVAFSPDTKYVVSGSWDGTARVWEAASGQEIARMTYAYGVYSVAFSPDGKYVVSGGCDLSTNAPCVRSSARIWDVTNGREIARMAHGNSVNYVVFSPDGKYVVSGGCDSFYTHHCMQSSARVWEAATGKEISRMMPDSDVTSAAFSPDGKVVVSGSWDNTARVWEAATGKEIARMTHGGTVESVAFSPDGKNIASGGCDQRIYPSGVCAQGSVRVWEATTGKEIARMTYDSTVKSVAFSPDGKYIVSGGGTTARVWEAKGDNETARMAQGTISYVAFSPDGKYVVSGSNDKTARVWEAATGKEIARMTHDGTVRSVAFSPDGRYVVSGGGTTACVWEAATGKEIARMTHHYGVISVAFSPDGKYVASGGEDDTARVWEAATGKEIARMTHDYPVYSVVFSPDGKYVVSGSNDRTARVWETATGKEIARMTHDGTVWSVAFSPDGKFVVSGSDDGTARVWEAATGKEIARMTDSTVYSVAFSPDGKYVVSGCADGTARVWEAATGKEIAHMTHDSFVNSVAFSPDGKFVVSGSYDHTARVWETATGQEVARMTYDGSVASVTFSPDGKYVVSGGCDQLQSDNPCTQGSARVWIYRPEDLIADACSRVTRNLTRAEWQQYIGDALPYQAVCPNLQIEP